MICLTGRSLVAGPALGRAARIPPRRGALASSLAASGLFAPSVFGAMVDEPPVACRRLPREPSRRRRPFRFRPTRRSGFAGAWRRSWPTRPRLKQLVKAYGALKALQSSPDNPINWCNQANIHYNHCSFPGPNAYYLQIHFGWLFFPWHRGYLYFYETIMGYLIDDPSFALPYWDWTTTPVVPDVFFDETSPLYDQTRESRKGSRSRATRRSSITPRRVHHVPGESAELFAAGFEPAGAELRRPARRHRGHGRFQGKVEAGPHDAVHSWVGGDMGSFDTAGRDLLFFAHHANVDRLWWLWQQGTGHTNPTSTTWSNQWFNFWNPNDHPPTGVNVSITVADVINPQAVNVIYHAPRRRWPPQNRGPAPAAGRRGSWPRAIR